MSLLRSNSCESSNQPRDAPCVLYGFSSRETSTHRSCPPNPPPAKYKCRTRTFVRFTVNSCETSLSCNGRDFHSRRLSPSMANTCGLAARATHCKSLMASLPVSCESNRLARRRKFSGDDWRDSPCCPLLLKLRPALSSALRRSLRPSQPAPLRKKSATQRDTMLKFAIEMRSMESRVSASLGHRCWTGQVHRVAGVTIRVVAALRSIADNCHRRGH